VAVGVAAAVVGAVVFAAVAIMIDKADAQALLGRLRRIPAPRKEPFR
jgi:hypothetical protein